MALINCPECNKEISEHAASCPHCGYALSSAPKEIEASKSKKRITLIIACIVGCLVAITLALFLVFSSFGVPGVKQYYSECQWCPNYKYVTRAKQLNTLDKGDGKAVYIYEFSDNDINEYSEKLEEMNFKRNPYSDGIIIVYSRKVEGVTQTISITPYETKNEVMIYAHEK